MNVKALPKLLSSLCAVCVFALPATSSHASPLPGQQGQADPAASAPGTPQTQTTGVSQRQAIGLAKQRFPGNVLRITLVGEGEGRRYQIRMENEGRVFTVYVHAVSGVVSGGT